MKKEKEKDPEEKIFGAKAEANPEANPDANPGANPGANPEEDSEANSMRSRFAEGEKEAQMPPPIPQEALEEAEESDESEEESQSQEESLSLEEAESLPLEEEESLSLEEEESLPEKESDCIRTLLCGWRERSGEEAPNPLERLREVCESDSESEMSRRLKESMVRIEGFRQGGHLTNGQIDEAVGRLLDISADLCNGVITAEGLDLLIKASEYEMQVEKARAEGEISGRNAAIEERLLSDREKSDGVPVLGGSAASAAAAPTASIFDLARFAR